MLLKKLDTQFVCSPDKHIIQQSLLLSSSLFHYYYHYYYYYYYYFKTGYGDQASLELRNLPAQPSLLSARVKSVHHYAHYAWPLGFVCCSDYFFSFIWTIFSTYAL